ncbi:MAG: bifunctional [glutamate--ammonia ligase]-adenylyl-L-tyrosine phosphorylase/[glutamate--ammonia-ligase] adenylyltransferase [Burkholderiaceae bacterium]
MKDSPFIGRQDWRGSRIDLDELPALSRYVQRHLRHAEVDAGAAERELGDALTRIAGTSWSASLMEQALGAFCAAANGESAHRLSIALRRLRRQVMMSLIARDATGHADLAEVVGTMTALAELSLQAAIALHARELAAIHGTPLSTDEVPQDLLVVGMGKLGGGELNVSSDIDLIFVYGEDGETRGDGAIRSITNHEFFARLGRRLIALLNDFTADGFVFRVDMRLRPNGVSGPLAVSNAMLEQYLMAQGREWERFAWLKNRVVSAPVFASESQFDAQCAALERVVRPFVFRKYLDFGAIAALRELHKLIRAEADRRTAHRDRRLDGAGSNVKLGRGGIRELEFVAQTFQIIRGGRELRLRSKSTLQTLQTLSAFGVLPAAICDQLCAAYVFLRNLEHALQYVDDLQTHVVPSDPAALEVVAKLLGARSLEAMLGEYRAIQKFVAETFDDIFAESDPEGPEVLTPLQFGPAGADDGVLIDDLRERGFGDPAATVQRVRSVLDSRRVQSGSEAARIGLQRLLQRALQTAIEHSHRAGAAHDIGPDEHLARFAQLADVVAGRNTYVALLNEFPRAFERVMRMLAASRWATHYLVRHPILLDELLDDRLLEHEPDWVAWSSAVQQQLTEASSDQEQQMNLLRDAHHAQVFRLLIADLDGRLTVERLADHLSALADATLELALRTVWTTLLRKHRAAPRFAVIAYGKLGGKELGYESDLDLIFLYDDDDPAAPGIYATFARRLLTWLNTQTSSGKLFEIDLRLRPDGNAGLMVSPFAAFSRYQRNDAGGGHGAWPWEHQALTRARFCAGEPDIGLMFEDERRHVLVQPRNEDPLRSNVLGMRDRILAGHPNTSTLFDVKHDRGGMIDIEFIVQYLVLRHARQHPALLRNAGNIALLQMAGELRLIDQTLAGELADAYRAFRRIQHRLRLNGAERARLPAQEVDREIAAVGQLWDAVFRTSESDTGSHPSIR